MRSTGQRKSARTGAHTLPIAAATAGLVAQARPQRAWSNPKAQLDMLCDVENWTLHDLRRTFGTNLAELGFAPHIFERTLKARGTICPAGQLRTSFTVLYRERVG